MPYKNYEFLGRFLHLHNGEEQLKGQVFSRESLSGISYNQNTKDSSAPLTGAKKYLHIFGKDRTMTTPTKEIPHVSFFGKKEAYLFVLEFSDAQKMKDFLAQFRDWISQFDAPSGEISPPNPEDMDHILKEAKNHDSTMAIFNRSTKPEEEKKEEAPKGEKPFGGFDLT